MDDISINLFYDPGSERRCVLNINDGKISPVCCIDGLCKKHIDGRCRAVTPDDAILNEEEIEKTRQQKEWLLRALYEQSIFFPGLPTDAPETRQVSEDQLRKMQLCSWPVFEAGECIKGALKIDGLIPSNDLQVTVQVLGMYVIKGTDLRGGPLCETKVVYHSTQVVQPDSSNRLLFPFIIQLKKDIPNSMQPLLTEAYEALHLLYTIGAILETSKNSKNSSTKKQVSHLYRGFWVEPRSDHFPSSDLMNPYEVITNFSTGIFGTSGDVKCTAKLPRRAFLRNEVIPVSLVLENNSASDLTAIEVWVKLKISAGFSTGIFPLSVEEEFDTEKQFIKKLEGEAFLPLNFSQCSLFKDLIPLSVPTYPPIQIHYQVYIRILRGRFRKNFDIVVPIQVIHNIRY